MTKINTIQLSKEEISSAHGFAEMNQVKINRMGKNLCVENWKNYVGEKKHKDVGEKAKKEEEKSKNCVENQIAHSPPCFPCFAPLRV